MGALLDVVDALEAAPRGPCRRCDRAGWVAWVRGELDAGGTRAEVASRLGVGSKQVGLD